MIIKNFKKQYLIEYFQENNNQIYKYIKNSSQQKYNSFINKVYKKYPYSSKLGLDEYVLLEELKNYYCINKQNNKTVITKNDCIYFDYSKKICGNNLIAQYQTPCKFVLYGKIENCKYVDSAIKWKIINYKSPQNFNT